MVPSDTMNSSKVLCSTLSVVQKDELNPKNDHTCIQMTIEQQMSACHHSNDAALWQNMVP